MTASALLDLRPLMDAVVFPVLTAVITPLAAGFAGWALIQVGKVAKITVSQHQVATVEAAIEKGVNYAMSKAHAAADASGQVTLKAGVVADAANYVLPKIPGYLSALGITPQGLAERIEARLPAEFKAISPTVA